MHSRSFVAVVLLVASVVASPIRQQPLVHRGSPYTKDHRDPYDRKVDTYGVGIQPLPIVSSLGFQLNNLPRDDFGNM